MKVRFNHYSDFNLHCSLLDKTVGVLNHPLNEILQVLCEEKGTVGVLNCPLNEILQVPCQEEGIITSSALCYPVPNVVPLTDVPQSKVVVHATLGATGVRPGLNCYIFILFSFSLKS